MELGWMAGGCVSGLGTGETGGAGGAGFQVGRYLYAASSWGGEGRVQQRTLRVLAAGEKGVIKQESGPVIDQFVQDKLTSSDNPCVVDYRGLSNAASGRDRGSCAKFPTRWVLLKQCVTGPAGRSDG